MVDEVLLLFIMMELLLALSAAGQEKGKNRVKEGKNILQDQQ